MATQTEGESLELPGGLSNLLVNMVAGCVPFQGTFHPPPPVVPTPVTLLCQFPVLKICHSGK